MRSLDLENIIPVELGGDDAFPGIADTITVDGRTIASRGDLFGLEEAACAGIRSLVIPALSTSGYDSGTDSPDRPDDENSDATSTSSKSTSKSGGSSSSSGSTPSKRSVSSSTNQSNSSSAQTRSRSPSPDGGAESGPVQWILRATYPPRKFEDLVRR